MSVGRLFGVGVGPGDPELMTLKAQRLLAASDVVAHFAARARPGNAWTIIAALVSPAQTVLRLEYPVTTEAVAPADYESAIAAFYDESAARIAAHLDAASDVAVVCEGDPFFYGSYMYIHQRLADRYPTTVVPGVTSFSAASAAAGVPLVSMNESLTVLPGVLPPEQLKAALANVDAAVVMKVGRHLGDVRAAAESVGLADQAIYVERASCTSERVLPLLETDDVRGPVLLVGADPRHRAGRASAGAGVSGRLTVVGIGPGRADWCTPAVAECIASATDLVGYEPYLALIDAGSTSARRHASDNRVEADRACHALDLAEAGGDVVVVSSGDPGVFAMASAVMEQLAEHSQRWLTVDVSVLPGITAAQALASRVGAPIGHDFCVISLSDVLKPWSVIEQRLLAVAGADFVIALYNPRSRHRPHQFAAAMDLIGQHRSPTTPVIVGRHVGRPEESVLVTDLATLDPETVDMSTIVIVGSSTTRVLNRPLGCSVYTPRSYAAVAT